MIARKTAPAVLVLGALSACGGGGSDGGRISSGIEPVSRATTLNATSGNTFSGQGIATAVTNLVIVGDEIQDSDFSLGSLPMTLTQVNADTLTLTVNGNSYTLRRDPDFPSDFENEGGNNAASLTFLELQDSSGLFSAGVADGTDEIVGTVSVYGFASDVATVNARVDTNATYSGFIYLSANTESGDFSELTGDVDIGVNFLSNAVLGAGTLDETGSFDNSLGLGGADGTLSMTLVGDITGNRVVGTATVSDPAELTSADITTMDMNGSFFGGTADELSGTFGALGTQTDGTTGIVIMGGFATEETP